ncbi:MAG: ATP-binding protein [Saprospiraceae bacterium]
MNSHLLKRDVFNLAGISCGVAVFCFLLGLNFISPSIAIGATAQDSTFFEAERLKAQLVAAGDTSLMEREILLEELREVCNNAQHLSIDDYISTLNRSKRLVRDLHDAYEYLEVLRESAKRWENEDRSIADLAEVYLAIARTRIGLKDFEGGYLYLNKTAALPIDSLSSVSVAKFNFFQGYLAYFANDNEKAVSYFKQASDIPLGPHQLRLKIITLNALSHCSNLLFDFEEGLKIADRALLSLGSYRDTLSYSGVTASVLINLAEAEHGVGRKRKAYNSVKMSLEHAEESKLSRSIGNAHCIWSRILRRDNRLDESKEKALLAIQAYTKGEDPYSKLLAMNELILTTKRSGEFEASLLYTDRYHTLKDSLKAAKIYVESNSARLLRKSETQQSELALLKENSGRQTEEVKRQRLELIGFISLALLSVLFTFIIYSRLRRKRDIQLQLESEVARRTEALSLQAERVRESNEELERFAYIASHDLKTPIRNVVSFLNLIERRLPKGQDESLSEFIQIASENAQQMHHLINDVLEFSKLNSDSETLSETFELGQEVEKYANRLSNENVDISVKGGASINAPRLMVMQVVQNLIENGVKYNTSADAKIDVSIAEVDGYVTCQVQDNGIGIDPQYKERIFELFKRLHTSDQYEGTGLGLALCKKIVDRFDGEIAVESNPGEGSVFTVKLPTNCTDNIHKFKRMKESIAEMN